MKTTIKQFEPDPAWLLSLRNKSLEEIVRIIHNAAKSDLPRRALWNSLADSFERVAPDRIDYSIFRDLVFSHQGRRKQTEPISLTRALVSGLRSPDREVSEGSRVVASRLDFRHIQYLRSAGISALEELACALDGPQPKPRGFDAILCDGVCIPHVKLLIAEQIERLKKEADAGHAAVSDPRSGEEGPAKILYPVAQLYSIYESVDATLSVCFSRSETSIRDALPVTDEIVATRGDGVPWIRGETFSAVAITLIDLASYLKSCRAESAAQEDNARLMQTLDRATDFTQCGWLTLRVLREIFRSQHQEKRKSNFVRNIEKREIKALCQLAEFERLRGNHIRAGQYSVFAVHQNLPFVDKLYQASDAASLRDDSGAITTSERVTVGLIANRLGLYTPGEVLPGRKPSTPHLYSGVLQSRSDFEPFFMALSQYCGQESCWDGWDENILRRLMSTGVEPTRAALRAAIRTGNLRFVREALSKKDSNLLRELVLDAASAPLVLEYANALASVQQKAVSLVNQGETFRASLRALWKKVDAEDLSFSEMLFLHHVKVGMAHHALSSHAAGPCATWALYNSAPSEDRSKFFEDFVHEVRHGHLRPVLLKDFQQRKLAVGNEDAFISLVTYEGHVASILACGVNGSFRSLLDSRGAKGLDTSKVPTRRDDWDQIVESFSMIAKDCVATGDSIQVHGAIEGLAQQLFEAAVRVNPNFKRIVLHCDSMFRLVPWQHLFQYSSRLASVRGERLQDMRTAGIRRARDDGYLDFAVWHVPGVAFDASESSSSNSDVRFPLKNEWSVIPDPSDAFCEEVASAIQNPEDPTLKPVSVCSRLSLICHGRPNSFINRIEIGGMPLSNQELNALFGGYELATVHACYGGHTLHNPFGDLGGVPGLLLNHGTSFVLASPLPVLKEPAIILERYLSQLTSYEPLAVERAYLDSLKEAEGLAYYNLYSNKIAPRLVNPD